VPVGRDGFLLVGKGGRGVHGNARNGRDGFHDLSQR
jgi:hypothetical protein